MSDGPERQKGSVREPPQGFWSSLRYIGPGFILSAALVGSGELIVTTALGAKAGYVLLWFIIFSCGIKVVMQLEYGRHCICYGRPTFQAWNFGQPEGKLHWSNYVATFFWATQLLGFGGLVGGTAQVLSYAFSIPTIAGVGLLVVVIPLLLSHGRYGPVEWIAAAFNFVFALAILYCVLALQRTSYAFTMSDLAGGFSFHLSSETFVLALGLFGITGMGAAEIFVYPYWCLEKGYAAWTGPRDDSPEWTRRTRGWIRVMKIDAFISLVIYTTTTCSFYILGAAVLKPQSEIADGNELIIQLSDIFTKVLGEWSKDIFMVCAFFVLFSTLFGATAGATRIWTDLFGVLRWIDPNNDSHRRKSIAILAWANPVIWGISYLFIEMPLFLIVLWGIANSLFLTVVAYQALQYRYRQTIPQLRPSPGYDIALWVGFVSFCILALGSLL